MNKFLLSIVSLMIACSSFATVQKKSVAVNTAATAKAATSANLQMGYVVSSLYDQQHYKVPNYYFILSNSESAKYNANTGDISAPAGSFTLIIDCFNYTPEDGVYLPAGTYTMIDGDTERPFGYTHEYSMLNYYDAQQGQISYQLDEPVVVERADNGIYSISTSLSFADGSVVNVNYTGPLNFGSSTEKPTVYPQINHNVTGNLNMGGISYYQGVTDLSSQGVSYFDLYDVKFDQTNGYMEAPGLNLCMMIAHKRFTKRADYAVCPGTYTNASNLARNTWYPAREIDYMGITMPFGSYLRELKIVNGERSYTYAYLKTGTFTIEDNGDGTYKGMLDAVTTLGYTVQVTWSGKITLNTDNAQFTATVSDLTDDVEMDFSKLEKGRIYHSGLQGGCRTFIVDLGSPSGKDEAINNGGDLLRMEFLSPTGDHLLKPGFYTVVPRRWNSNELAAGGTYEPMSLNKGHFDGNGAQVGTRYAHFRPGSYCVYDMVGPAEEGSVRVSTTDYKTYQFDIDLTDDAGFKMTGYWDKPLEYNYDADALLAELGVEEISGEMTNISVVKEGSNILIYNAGNAPAELYSLDGRLITATTADRAIPADGLKGIYIIKVNNNTIKISL